MNPQYLSHADMIGQFVLKKRNDGHELYYEDHHIIQDWVEVSPNLETLLIVLDEYLPLYFRKKGSTQRPKSLKRAHSVVIKRLKSLELS